MTFDLEAAKKTAEDLYVAVNDKANYQSDGPYARARIYLPAAIAEIERLQRWVDRGEKAAGEATKAESALSRVKALCDSVPGHSDDTDDAFSQGTVAGWNDAMKRISEALQ
jgi:hypothetical protein